MAAPWESGRGIPDSSLEQAGVQRARFGEQVVCVRPEVDSPASDQGLCE